MSFVLASGIPTDQEQLDSINRAEPAKRLCEFKIIEMAAHTLLLDFSVDPTQVKSESQLSLLSTNMENILRDYLSNLKLVTSFNIDGGLFRLYTSDLGAVTSLRIFNNGLITLNVEYYKGDKQEPLLSFEVSELSKCFPL